MPGLKELTKRVRRESERSRLALAQSRGLKPRVLATLERSRALHAQLVGDRLIQKIRNEQ